MSPTKASPLTYKVLSHTADLRLAVWGRTLTQLFYHALLGLNYVWRAKITPTGKRKKLERKIKVAGQDTTSLLVNFLNEVLWLSQTKKELYLAVEFTSLTPTKLSAKLKGAPVQAFGEDIKAVTYHQAEVKKVGQSWQTILVFDV